MPASKAAFDKLEPMRNLSISILRFLVLIIGVHQSLKSALNNLGKMGNSSCRQWVFLVVARQCSNDTDFKPLLEALKTNFPEIRLGLVPPVKNGERAVAGSLSKLVHWKKLITKNQLQNSQLPKSLKSGKIRIPKEWL